MTDEGPLANLDRPQRILPSQPAGEGNANSLVNEAYQALKMSILDGTLPPGYQAVEKRIAEQLKMSRTPVHEAVIRLQNEGFLVVLPRRGVQILPLSGQDMRETYDVIIALEGMAAVLIANMRDARHPVIDRLAHATDEMEAALNSNNLKAWAAADDEFHRRLVAECGNARLARLAATVTDQAQRARTVTLRMRPLPVTSAVEHREILAALRKGDSHAARTAVEFHRQRASSEIMDALSNM
jgi:DNA-binding GntR family transcriptional regulator